MTRGLLIAWGALLAWTIACTPPVPTAGPTNPPPSAAKPAASPAPAQTISARPPEAQKQVSSG